MNDGGESSSSLKMQGLQREAFLAAFMWPQELLEERSVMHISLQTRPQECAHRAGVWVRQSQCWMKEHCVSSTVPPALHFTLLRLPPRWEDFTAPTERGGSFVLGKRQCSCATGLT